MTSFEATNSAFNINNENNSFSFSTPGPSRDDAENLPKIQKSLELKSQNDIELHVQSVREKGNQRQVGDNEFKLTDLDTHKNQEIDELKNVEYIDLEDIVFRME